MKQKLKKLANPVKRELFEEIGFTKDEYALMKYLYLDKLDQWWVAEEIGVSIPTLCNWHNNCIDQVVSFFNFQKYKYEHNELNDFLKFFG